MHEHELQRHNENQSPVPDRTDPSHPESALEYQDPEMLPTIKGTGYLVLNGLRALTLIGLAMTMASSWIMIVLSGLGGRFDFFDSASHFFVFGVAIFLFISELNIRSFRGYFARTWPVLCPTHSLVYLGLAMVVMGCAIMGDLVKPAYSVENLGMAMWRLVLATGILSLTFGVFNVVASLIFNTSEGEGKIRRRITARMIRSHGDQAKGIIIEKQDPSFPDYYSSNQSSGSYPDDLPPAVNNHYYPPQPEHQPELDTTFKARAHRWTKAAFPKNFRKSGRFPIISDPIVPSVGVVAATPQMNSDNKRDHNVDLERGDSFRSNRRHSGGRFPINTDSNSARNNSPPPTNDRASPVSPNVQRPPTVLHPYYNGGRRSPSLYSDANMSRF